MTGNERGVGLGLSLSLSLSLSLELRFLFHVLYTYVSPRRATARNVVSKTQHEMRQKEGMPYQGTEGSMLIGNRNRRRCRVEYSSTHIYRVLMRQDYCSTVYNPIPQSADGGPLSGRGGGSWHMQYAMRRAGLYYVCYVMLCYMCTLLYSHYIYTPYTLHIQVCWVDNNVIATLYACLYICSTNGRPLQLYSIYLLALQRTNSGAGASKNENIYIIY